ncbi:MAG: hypothetical protein M3114_04980 [Thermoproteota archaeon]|nr:hypothetical protein [Thermoproteota archaeon]
MIQPLREQETGKGWKQECSTDELYSFSQERMAKGGESDEVEVTEFDKFGNRKKVMTEVVLAYTFEG